MKEGEERREGEKEEEKDKEKEKERIKHTNKEKVLSCVCFSEYLSSGEYGSTIYFQLLINNCAVTVATCN